MQRLLIISIAGLLTGACGNIGDLEPPRGQPLPVKPMMARSTPTPNDLLSRPTEANPSRVDELMRRSTPRISDRFDLPPPSGAAPDVPVQASEEEEEAEVSSKGPVKEQ